MKNFFRFSMCAVILAITLVSCGGGSDDDITGGGKGSKLSPPSWLQGNWGDENGIIVIYKVTKDDVFMMGKSLKTYVNQSGGGASASLKETKNTSSLYELTIKADDGEGTKASFIWSFKKGDGTYIDAAFIETGNAPAADDYDKLYKKQ